MSRVFSRNRPLRRETQLVEIHSRNEMFPLAQQNRREGQMDFIDVSSHQVLANDGHPSANANVLAPGRIFGQLQRGVDSLGAEVKRRTPGYGKRSPSMMREHEDGRKSQARAPRGDSPGPGGDRRRNRRGRVRRQRLGRCS